MLRHELHVLSGFKADYCPCCRVGEQKAAIHSLNKLVFIIQRPVRNGQKSFFFLFSSHRTLVNEFLKLLFNTLTCGYTSKVCVGVCSPLSHAVYRRGGPRPGTANPTRLHSTARVVHLRGRVSPKRDPRSSGFTCEINSDAVLGGSSLQRANRLKQAMLTCSRLAGVGLTILAITLARRRHVAMVTMAINISIST